MTGPEIVEKLRVSFHDKIGDYNEMKTSAYATRMGSYVDVKDSSYIRDICLYLRDEPSLQFDNLMALSSVDNGDKTLSTVYHLESTKLKQYIALKATVSADNAKMPSVTSVWSHAIWEEREAWDMMGIWYEGHPDMRRILLDEDYPGHPLRKDFQVPDFYRGMKVPY